MPKKLRSKNISLGKAKTSLRKDTTEGQRNLNRRGELAAKIRAKLTKKPDPDTQE